MQNNSSMEIVVSLRDLAYLGDFCRSLHPVGNLRGQKIYYILVLPMLFYGND